MWGFISFDMSHHICMRIGLLSSKEPVVRRNTLWQLLKIVILLTKILSLQLAQGLFLFCVCLGWFFTWIFEEWRSISADRPIQHLAPQRETMLVLIGFIPYLHVCISRLRRKLESIDVWKRTRIHEVRERETSLLFILSFSFLFYLFIFYFLSYLVKFSYHLLVGFRFEGESANPRWESQAGNVCRC